MRPQLHYITQHYTTLITLHYATTTTATTVATTTKLHYTILQLQLHYLTLHYTTLYQTTVHNTSVHYKTLQYTTLITPHHNYNCNFNNCNYTNYITLELQLHYTTLHYDCSYNYNCTTPHYIQQLWWGDHCNHCSHSKTQLQPPFGPSVNSLCHPWFTTTNLSYRFPIFETSATALCGTTGKINPDKFI